MALRFIISASIISIALTGCALAPGHKMDASKISHDGSDESSQVELIEITPKVITDARTSNPAVEIAADLLAYQPESYRIGANDVLFITVWNHPELTVPGSQFGGGDTNGRTVKPDGSLFYPYIGNIQAAGKTTEELRLEITQKLATFIERPQVDVGVLRFFSQRIILSGAFTNSQPIAITNKPLTLLEAMGIGQMNTQLADLSNVSITRQGKTYVLDVYALTRTPSAINQVYLQDGDSVHLPFNDDNKIYVLGEVTRPQALAIKSSTINLTDAISTAGGLHQLTSKGQDVYVIRGVDDLSKEKAKIFQLNAKSPSAFILANHFQLQPQDVVYVGPTGLTRWNRVIMQILPSLSVLGLTSTVANDVDDINKR